MENLINELYYGNICPVEQMGGATPEEKEILKRIHENEEKLRATLDEQENAILDAIKDDWPHCICFNWRKTIPRGVQLGSKTDGRNTRHRPSIIAGDPPQFSGGK